LASTIQGIQGAGMTPLGTFLSKEDFEQSGGYVIWEVKGIKIAMMAFTKGMVDGAGLPAVSENCVNLLYEDYMSTFQKVDTEGITKIVRNAAAHDPDIMIAMVHWGSELSDQNSKSQKKISTLLQDEGVDIILGTHPHFVQKMELDTLSGRFVAWSLGDLFDTVETNYSVLVDLEITQNGATGKTKVTGFDYVPVYLEKGADGAMRILRIEEAIAAYENQYLDRVSEETYNAMKTALQKIKSRVGTK
jgi:poly-gamma-glutamate synthesis protein (capsule biosynthesis protein)